MNREEFLETQVAFQLGACHAEAGLDLQDTARRLAQTRGVLIYHDPADRGFIPPERAVGVVQQPDGGWASELEGDQFKQGDKIRAGRYADQLSALYAAGLTRPMLMDMKDAVLEQNLEFPCFQYVRRSGAANSILWPLPRVHGIGRREFCGELDPDELQLRDKKPVVFWRGAMRGFSTLNGKRSNIKFVIKAYTENRLEHDQLIAHLSTVPRYIFVSRHFGRPGFDIGFCQGRAMAFYNQVPEIARYNRPYAQHSEYLHSKYLMSVQGTDVGTSFGWQLATNCVLFKEGYDWEVFFDGHLRPWEHYVPIALDFSDVEEKIAWCESHPEACEQMIEKRHRIVPYLIDSETMNEAFRRVVRGYEDFYDRWAVAKPAIGKEVATSGLAANSAPQPRQRKNLFASIFRRS